MILWGSIILVAGLLLVYGTVVWFTGLAAKRKGRSRAIWITLTLFPLGPIAGPLLLASFPTVGEPASVAQKIGRGILIVALLLSLIGNIMKAAEPVNGSIEQERVTEKAKEIMGYYEPTDVYTHYKQMNVAEITTCLALTKAAKTMIESAELQEEGMWLFDTQGEADRFNAINRIIEERECNDRTYDFSDLDKALEALPAGEFEDLDAMIDDWIKASEPRLQDKLTNIARALNDNAGETTVFEDSVLLRAYANDTQMVVELGLTAYDSYEINQVDINKYLSPQLVDYVCNADTLRSVLNQGGNFLFELWGNDSKQVGSVEVSDACQT
jgi:hypothetical protein